MNDDPKQALSDMDKSDARVMTIITWIVVILVVVMTIAPAFVLTAAKAGTPDVIFLDGFEGPGGAEPPLSCDGAAPEGFVRETQLQTFVNGVGYEVRDVRTLRGLYGGRVTTTKIHWELRASRYVAFAINGAELEFDLPGRSSYAPGGEPQNGEPMTGFTSMTLSRCAGDFRFTGDAPGQLCRGTSRANVNDILYFDIADVEARHPQLANVCTIDRTSTYFLNVVFADARDGLEPFELDCPEGETRCGWRWNIE